MKPKAELVNNLKEFKWRLVMGKEKSRWCSHYSGILTHKFNDGRTFGLATGYWDGSLPIEVPFEIIEQK